MEHAISNLKAKDNLIEFKPLDFSDIPIMHQWFNMPHVQAFYSLRAWSEKEVFDKLIPYIKGEKPVIGLIAFVNQKPIGYVQYYKVVDYPWPAQDLSQDIINNAAGMDILIGEKSMIGRGIGQLIINEFLQAYIWPKFNYCIVDPSTKHKSAIRCYHRSGFKKHKVIKTKDAMGCAEKVQLMIIYNQIITVEDIINHIIKQEKRLLDKTESLKSLSALLDDEFIEIGSSAKLFNKADVIEWLKSDDKSIRLGTEFAGKIISENVILLTYISNIQDTGEAPIKTALRASIWRKNSENEWKMIFHQGTPINP